MIPNSPNPRRARESAILRKWASLLGLIALLSCASLIARPGDKIPVQAGNPSVSPLSPERIRQIRLSDRDVLGDMELAKKDDPSFASVAAYLPPLKKPREIVGVKYHPHDIGVASDGSLELSDDVDAPGSPVAFFEVGLPPVRFGSLPEGCAKSLVHGHLPIVVAEFEHQGLRYRQTVFGWSEGLSPDRELWAFLEFEVKNPGGERRLTEVRLAFKPENSLNPAMTWRLDLAPGVFRRIHVRIPFDLRGAKCREISDADYVPRLNEVRGFWSADLARGLNLELPERRVTDAAQAWLAYASLDVDKRNGVLEPHDGAGFYEQVYGYSAALYPQALDLWGRHEEAALILESLLTFQKPDGLFTSNFGTPDPGTLLSALWAHYELTGDAAWLKGVAPRMIKMADWIIRKRGESMPAPREAGSAGKRPVTYGLIKFSPYCDYPTPSYDYFGDAYCAVGLEKTSLALAAAGLPEEAARIGREAAAYRRDILASMDAAVLERGGLKILPLEPETQRLLKGSQYRANGYYGLIAACLLESEFLPAADPRAAWVTRFMEEKGGLRLGMAEFDGGIDHAYTYGYWLNALALDKAKPAILGFYGSLAYGMSRETFTGVEVTHHLTGDNEPTLPHLYSCTQQLRLLRMMLVREDGDDLWIGQAAPRPWLEAGKKIEIRGASTRFGDVSFAIAPQGDGRRIAVDLTAPARTTPRKILLRLRTPDGRAIAEVKVDGRPITAFGSETVTLDRPRGTMKIVVGY